MSPRGVEQNEAMRAETLARITQAALMVFADYGYFGATMKRITEVSGLSYGLVYHYFPSKEEVFRHLIDSSFDASQHAMDAVLSEPGTDWEKIERLSNFLVEEALSGESSRYFLVVLQALTEGKGIPGFIDHVAKRIEDYYKTLAPVIAGAQRAGEAAEGDPLVLAAVYFSLLQGLALLACQGNGMEGRVTPTMLARVIRKEG